MDNNKEYFAFISYKREDEKWAMWLQNKLEHYKLPSNLNGRTDLPKEIRPVFRDKSELAGGVLTDEIQSALEASKYLIVICSPRAAQSQWVGKEVQSFIDMGRMNKIIPFIIGGTAHAQNPEEECFPSSLLNLPQEQELLGINIDEMGRDAAAVKVVAQMFGLKFDALWQRYEREQKKKRIWIIAASIAGFLIMASVAMAMYAQRQQTVKANWQMMENQARFVAEKSMELAEKDSYLARLLAVEVLPKDLSHPERPYTSEAECALRTSCYNGKIVLDSIVSCRSIEFSPDGNQLLVVLGKFIYVWNANTGKLLCSLYHEFSILDASFSSNGKKIVSTTSKKVSIWDIETNKVIDSIDVNAKGVVFWNDDKCILCIDDSSRNWFDDRSEIVQQCVKLSRWDLKTKEQLSYAEIIIPNSYLPKSAFCVTEFSYINEDEVYWGNGDIGVAINLITGDYMKTNYYDVILSKSSIYYKTVDVFEKINYENSFIQYSDKGNKFAVVNLGDIAIYTIIPEVVYESSPKVNDIDFSDDRKYALYTSDGEWNMTISDGDTVRIQRISNGDFYELRIKDKEVHCATFNPKSKSYSTSSMGKLTVYDIETGDTINSFPVHTIYSSGGAIMDGVTSINYHPNGKTIATSSNDCTAAIWNLATGECIHVLKGHSAPVNSAVFSPNGDYIVTASADKTIKIWSVYTGSLLASITELSDVKYASLSPDGKSIISYSQDTTVRIYDFPSLQDLIDQTRERFKDRPLTPEERHQYYLE